MGVLRGWVAGEQAFGGGERGQQPARAFEPVRFVGEGANAAGATLLARQRQPLGELAALGLGEAMQQLARIGVGRIEADLDVSAQAGDVAAFEQLAAERFAQPEQALAQVGAGAFGIDVGPEQCGEAAARRRPFDRQVGEQQRVLLLDRDDRAIGAYELRLVGEIERSGADGGLGHGRGREILEAKAQGASISGCVAQHSPALSGSGWRRCSACRGPSPRSRRRR